MSTKEKKSAKHVVIVDDLLEEENELENVISKDFMFRSEKNSEHIPDGGCEAYLVLLGSFIGTLAVFGIEGFLGAIQTFVSTHQLADVKETTISWVFSLFLGVMYFFSVFTGKAFDKFGARPPLLVGSVLLVAGLFLTAECKTVYQFVLAFSIVTGLGACTATSPLVGVLSHWFLRKRGMAASLATVGGLIGSSVFAIMVQSLYGKVGFKWAIRILAFVCMLCMSISLVLVKERTQPEIITTTAATVTNPHPETEIDITKPDSFVLQLSTFLMECFDFSHVLDWRFILLTLGTGLSELNTLSTLTYLTSFALHYNVTNKQAYYLITVVNSCGIPSRICSGFIADKYGRFNFIIMSAALIVISIIGLWLPSKGNIGLLYGFGALFGISTSSVLSLIPACCGQICTSEDFGKVYGTMYFFVAFITLLGMYFASLVVGNGADVNYTNLVYYEGGIAVANLLVWILARYSAVKFRKGRF